MKIILFLGLLLIAFLSSCNRGERFVQNSGEATSQMLHSMECYRVDNNNNPKTVYRCENDEVICYTRSDPSSGMACEFKTGSNHE